MSLCESCHAGCCRSFAVPVSGADIIRIEKQLGLSFWDFTCRWADPHGLIARKYAPHFCFSDEPYTPFVVCLMHAESWHQSGTTKCRFLVESPADDKHRLGEARCGIYQSRPSACRVFPTRLNDTGELVIIYDVPSRGRSTDDSTYDLCPRQWEPSDLDSIETVQSLVVAKYEMTFFAQLAEIWNRRPRPWDVFPEFLHMVYGSRIMRESATQEHELEPEVIKLSMVARNSEQEAA